jgi:hypothetical protein
MGTAHSKSILKMLNSFKEYIDFDIETCGWSDYWIREEPQECGYCDMGQTEGDGIGAGEYEMVDCEMCGGSGYEEEERNEGCDISESQSNSFWAISEEWEKEVEDFLSDKTLEKVEEEKTVEKVEEVSSSVKFPQVSVELVGHDGNAFAIMGRVSKAMQRAGVDREDIDQYKKESMSGDYDHLLRVAMSYVNVA